jgi:hypothetical protein
LRPIWIKKNQSLGLYVLFFNQLADEIYTGQLLLATGQLPLALELCEGTHEAGWSNSGSGLLVGSFSRLAGPAVRLSRLPPGRRA